MHGKRSFFLLILLILQPVFADDAVYEEVLEVTAGDLSSSSSDADDVDLKKTSSVFSIIDVSSKKGKASSLGAILERETGIQIKKAGTAGSFATVSLRGTSSSQAAVYIDGIPLTSGTNGTVDLSDIPLEIVETIEIFRGSSPAEFTENPIGGVIHVRTGRSFSGEHVTCSAASESFGTYRASLKGVEQFAASDLVYSLSFMSTQGDFDFTDNNGTEYNTDDDKVTERINNDCIQWGGGLTWRLYAGDDTIITLSETAAIKEQGIPGRENNQNRNTRYESTISFFNVTVERNMTGSPENRLFFRTFWKSRYDEFRDLYSETGLGSRHVGSEINEIGLAGLGTFRIQETLSTVTFRISGESFVPDNKLDSYLHTYEPYPSSRDAGLFSYTLAYTGERAVPSLSMRYTAVNSHIDTELFSNEAAEELLTFQTGLKYLFSEEWTFKLNYGTYIRLPGMGELFGDWGYFLGNPELETEKGINIEAACEYAPSDADRAWAGLKRMHAALFRTDIRDYIQYLFNAQGMGRPSNLGSAEITGIECSAIHEKERIRFDHGLTLQNPVNRTYIDYNYGNILPGRAQIIYSAELSWTGEQLELFTAFLYESGVFYDSANLRRAPDKKPVGIGAGWSFSTANRAVLRIDNIFDERYEDYGGYPLPGRVFSLSMHCSF